MCAHVDVEPFVMIPRLCGRSAMVGLAGSFFTGVRYERNFGRTRRAARESHSEWFFEIPKKTSRPGDFAAHPGLGGRTGEGRIRGDGRCRGSLRAAASPARIVLRGERVVALSSTLLSCNSMS